MPEYDSDIWFVHDDLLWVKTDEPIWIPNILDDGSVQFVFTNVKYHINAKQIPYTFVEETVYHFTDNDTKYLFVANPITDWHQS